MATDVNIDINARDNASGVFARVNSALGGVFQTAMGFITAQVFERLGGELINFTKDAVMSASNLNESVNKTLAIFGNEGEGIVTWAKNAAVSVGLSEQAALDAAGGFATFAKSAGLTGDELTKFATENVGLAADLASFYNTDVTDAAYAMQAALRGETEPLRRYGILLDDASMRQEALAMGIVSTTKHALTPQQRVLAASALMFNQSKDAQGDFAKTSAQAANGMRIFQAQLENAKSEIGTAFLPILLQVMTVFNTDFIPAIHNVVEATKPFIEKFVSGVGPAIEKVGRLFQDFAATIGSGNWRNFFARLMPESIRHGFLQIYDRILEFKDTFKKFTDQLDATIKNGYWRFFFSTWLPKSIKEGGLKVFDEVMKIKDNFFLWMKFIQDWWAANGQGIWDSIAATVSDAINRLTTAFDLIVKWWDLNGAGIMEAAATMYSGLITLFDDLASKVGPLVDDNLAKLAKWFFDNGPLIQDAMKGIADFWANYLVPAFMLISSLLVPLLSGIVTMILGLAKAILLLLAAPLGNFPAFIETIIGVIRTGLQTIDNMLYAFAVFVAEKLGGNWDETLKSWGMFWNGLVKAAQDWAAGMVKWIADGAAFLVNGLNNMASSIIVSAAVWVINAGILISRFIEAIKKGIQDRIESIKQKVKDIITSIKKTISSWIELGKTLAADFVDGIVKGIQDNIDKVKNALMAAFPDWFGTSPGKAVGGAASGLTMVGERGPELVRLPGGSHVYPNSQSMAMMKRLQPKQTASITNDESFVNYGSINISANAENDLTGLMRQIRRFQVI